MRGLMFIRLSTAAGPVRTASWAAVGGLFCKRPRHDRGEPVVHALRRDGVLRHQPVPGFL